MKGPILDLLAADHRRLGALLERAAADPARFDHEAFEAFRAGLLRHIGIEEKILLGEARRRRGGTPLAIAARLREDHGVLGALLVPTPDAALAGEIRRLLDEHDALEEEPGGLYDACDDVIGADPAVLGRIAAAPEVPLAPHFDGRGTHRTAASARAMLRGRGKR
jgi:hypothetical protein